MHISFSSYFQDPQNGLPLELTIIRNKGDHIIEGAFSNEFNSYHIIDGIPRFVISKKIIPILLGFNGGNGLRYNLRAKIRENLWRVIP